MDALVTLLGRLHMLTVHFPIALWLLLAVLIIHPRWRRRGEVLRPLGWLALGVTALAVVTGLVYVDEHGFQGRGAVIIDRHRLLGLASLAAGGVAMAIVAVRGKTADGLPSGAAVLALIAAVGVGATGHYGGLSVHGEDHYDVGASTTPAPPADPAPTPAAAAADAPDFDTEVWPILKQSCVRCHGHKKQKGELRLDSLAAATADGESGKPALVPGDPDASEMIARVTLPQDHEDYMPAKGDPLTAAEVDTLTRWVAAGAPWPAALVP